MKAQNITKIGATWYFYAQIDGKRFKQSLKTSDKQVALTRARALKAAAVGGKFEVLDQTRTKRAFCTVGEVVTLYMGNARALGVKDASARTSAGCLRRMVAAATGLQEPLRADGESLGLLGDGRGAATVRAWKAAVLRESEGADAERDQQIKRSANSQLRQVKSIFKREALEFYQDHGLVLPHLDELRKAGGFAKVDAKSDYHAPDDALLARTFRATARLANGGEKARRMYAAICLAVGAGLRKSEIFQARWDWFTEREGRPFLRGDMVTKNRSQLDVPMLREWWERLQVVRPAAAAPGDFILGADCSETERREGAFNRISRWMTALGWRTEKKIHEFRAYVGSKIIQQHGIEAASAFLRHGQIGTTQRFYGRYYRLRSVDVQVG